MSDNELNVNQQSSIPTRPKWDPKWNTHKFTARLEPSVSIQLGHYMKEKDLRVSPAINQILKEHLSNYPDTSC